MRVALSGAGPFLPKLGASTMSGRRPTSHRWWARALGVILVVSTSHPARVAGSSDDAFSVELAMDGDGRGPLWLPTVPDASRLASSLADTARQARSTQLV